MSAGNVGRNAERDAFLQRYLAQETTPAEVGRAVDSDPELAPLLAQLDAVQRLVDEAGREEADLLTAAEDVRFPLGEARVAAAARAATGGAARPGARTRRLGLVGALLATAAALLLWVGRPGTGPPPEDPSLDRGIVRLQAPERHAGGWGTLRFDLLVDAQTLPELYIRVFRGSDPIGTPLLVSPPLKEAHWTPPLEESQTWGDVITWQVIARDPGAAPRVLGTWPDSPP